MPESSDKTPESGSDTQPPSTRSMAQRLRSLRAQNGMTQGQVAKRLGCHESAVSRWESGSRSPGAADLVGLADLFEVSVDALLGRVRQHPAAGSALLDLTLLRELEAAADVEAFDRMIEARRGQAVWFPVPEGAVLVSVAEAMQMAGRVADRFRESRYADRLFRPRS